MAYPGPFPIKVEQGGTGDTSVTANAVVIGDTADQLTSTNVGTNGQLLIGKTAGSPAFASLTSTGGTIVFTPGANSLNLESSGSTAASFPTDSGTATPSLGALTIAGGNNIHTTGSGSTVTINVSGTTNHAVQVGNASGSLTSLSVGTDGQILLGASAANPAFITPTAGTGLSLTSNATTLQYALSTPVSIANGGTNATSMATTDGTVIFDGTRLVTTATGTSGQVLTSNGAGVAPTYQPVSASGAVTSVSGGNNITITGTATAPIVNVSGTTNHTLQIGNSTGSLTSLAAATNGQIPIGSTGADPVIAAITAGSGISVTNGAGSITIAATGGTGTVTSISAGTGITLTPNPITTTGSVALTVPVVVSSGGTGATSITAHSLILGQGTSAFTALGAATNGQIPIGSTSNDPVLATITAGTGITVTNGSGSITIAANGAGFPYTDESTSFSAASNNGYFVTGTATATMPASPSQGDRISFIVDTTNVLTVAANTGQVLRIGSTVSASAGTAASNARGDSVTFIYRSSDTAWIAMSVVGTWTVT